MDNNYEIINQHIREFKSLIETSLSLKLDGISSHTNTLGFGNYNARITAENAKLKGTIYHYNSSNCLLHFTKLNNLLSIINECSFRLYNLHNSNDPDEYTYASDKLSDIYTLQGVDKERIILENEYVKENSFILSCTDINSINNKEFWKEYADDGRGVAIEIEILNNYDDWKYFYCSRVNYDNLEIYDCLINEWKQIQNKYPTNQYRISLNQLLSLNKSKKWDIEKEIRILTLLPDNYNYPFKENLFKKLVFNDFNTKYMKPTKYFKLPISKNNLSFIDNNIPDHCEEFWNIVPRVKIKKIHFGPNFIFKSSLKNYRDDLKFYIIEKMNGFRVEIPDYVVQI